MPDMTESQAVVEYTADEAAALKPRPMTSRYLMSFDQERLDEAMGVIGRYTDETGLRPGQIVWSPELEARQAARFEPYTVEHLQTKYGTDLLNYARDMKRTALGMVKIDLAGQAWLTDADAPGAEDLAKQPIVMFAALPTDSPAFQEPTDAEPNIVAQRAFCLWYVPTTTWIRTRVDKLTGAITRSMEGSWYDQPIDPDADIDDVPPPVGLGVHGIVRYFPSTAHAMAAHKQLDQAMRTYHQQVRLQKDGPRSKGADNRAVVDAERRAAQPGPARRI
jgi:hypothetical protein